MLFPECELLASEEPDFYGAMVKLDSLLKKSAKKVFWMSTIFL